MFKKGDKVKILSHRKRGTGSGIYWDCPDNPNGSENSIGKIGYYNCGQVFSRISNPGEYYGCYDDDELELVNDDKPKLKFKVGDRVKIINKLHGHVFKIGEIVTLNKNESLNYYAIGSDGDGWWLEEDEFELIEDKREISIPDGFYTEINRKCRVEGCDRVTFSKGLGGDGKTKYSGICRYHKKHKNINCNDPSCGTINKATNIMDKVLSFAKNLVLSADEKLLRKYNLKDSCGEYTETAEELVIQKLISDNEKYLIEIATKLQDEEKKNK